MKSRPPAGQYATVEAYFQSPRSGKAAENFVLLDKTRKVLADHL